VAIHDWGVMEVDDSTNEPFKTRLTEESAKQPRDRHPAGMDVNGVGDDVGDVVVVLVVVVVNLVVVTAVGVVVGLVVVTGVVVVVALVVVSAVVVVGDKVGRTSAWKRLILCAPPQTTASSPLHLMLHPLVAATRLDDFPHQH
jgi:hypothetical protein